LTNGTFRVYFLVTSAKEAQMGCIFGPIFGIIKTILAIIGLITVIVGVVIGLFVWQMTKPPAIEGEMHPVEYSQEAAESFNSKWDEFIEATPGEPVVMQLTEQEVSSKAQDMVDSLGVPMDVERVWVNFEPGSVRCWISIKGKLGPLTLYAAARGEVDIYERADGKTVLWYRIDPDGLSLPSWFRDFIQDKIEGALDIENLMEGEYELPEDMEISLTDLSVEEVSGEYVLQVEGLVLEQG